MTRPPLELLAAVRAAVEGVRTQVQMMGVPEAHWGTLDGADDVLLGALSDLESLESALRAQAEAGAGLREAVAQLMSDPWSYHEAGVRCIDCGRLDADSHSDDCAVVKIRVFIAQDEMRAALAQADAGGED